MARTTAQIIRDYRGPALFSFGFRVFFLVAAIWSAIATPLWLLPLLGIGEGMAAVTVDWHVHEMLFGYAGAVIVGYMTVAGANWTGHFPVAGWRIMVLVGVWGAGRVAMLATGTLPGPVVAVVEAAFLVAFALALWREQLAARNWRNIAPCIVISLLALTNIGFHAGMALPALGALAERAAIALVIFLIALMGGRLVPSFTRNWMARHKVKPEPASLGRFDNVALGLTGAGLAGWVLLPDAMISGVLLAAAGIGLLVRLLRWRGWAAARDGMVLILHLGYLWCALGLALLGASILLPGLVPRSAAIHALTAGAIGVMTLALMTRTSLSHTGRERRADGATLVIYLLINLAALTRVAAAFPPALQMGLLLASAIFWSLAFALFAVVYGPILAQPRFRKR